MRTGASVSGGAHLALIGLAIFSGALFGAEPRPATPFAEVTLMSGAEFEAALSAAPEFNPDLPPAPAAPNPGEERADVKLAETDAAPSAPRLAPPPPEAPARGEAAPAAPDPVSQAAVADVGTRVAAPAAPEDGRLVAAPEPAPEIAPVAENATRPAPSPRPAAPRVETTTPAPPEPEPAPVETAEPAPAPEPEPERAPEPEPQPEIAEATPPAEEPPVETLNDPAVPAPKLSPPPPTKPRDVAEAKKAERLARAAQEPEETGATRQAEAPSGGGTTRTVGEVSFRDRESLRFGIKGNFTWTDGGAADDTLTVTLQIELSPEGKIIAGPRVIASGGGAAARLRALESAGTRALRISEGKGVFRQLPRDRHASWRLMNVTFTPREIQFL